MDINFYVFDIYIFNCSVSVFCNKIQLNFRLKKNFEFIYIDCGKKLTDIVENKLYVHVPSIWDHLKNDDLIIIWNSNPWKTYFPRQNKQEKVNDQISYDIGSISSYNG